jgi:PIN domain nuclease of toxin-antitoxin system
LNPVLVDTHTLLWWLADAPDLSPTARELIADPVTEPLVSVASVWEIAIKRRLGKLEVPEELIEVIETEGFRWLAIDPSHAWAVTELPDHHRDPFDRLLVAQAIAERTPIVTADPRFASYGVDVRW